MAKKAAKRGKKKQPAPKKTTIKRSVTKKRGAKIRPAKKSAKKKSAKKHYYHWEVTGSVRRYYRGDKPIGTDSTGKRKMRES